MEARQVAELPRGDGWQYEPKWDGFRAVAIKNGRDTALYGKSGKSLARYFPEIMAALAGAAGKGFALDGELAIVAGETLSFDALQARLHPAESRDRKSVV